AEFEKEDIYEDLKKQEENTDFSKMSKQAAEVLKAEFHDKRFVTKRRMLGNIQFIGELYKKAMLKENVMKTCVETLLNAEKDIAPDRTLRALKAVPLHLMRNLEIALGKLIRTIGSTLDTDKNTLYMKELFRLMDKIANNKTINSRMRFMIRDLEELRKHNWVPRRKQDKAKTLDDIRKEAEAEVRGVGPPGRGGSSRGASDFRGGQGGPQDVRAARRAEQRGGGPSNDSFQRGGGGGSDRRNIDSRQEPRSRRLEHQSRAGAGVGDPRRGGDDHRRGGGPGPAAPPAAPQSTGASTEQPSETLTNKINGFVNEFVSEKDKAEALLSFTELPKGPVPETVSKLIVEQVIEGKAAERPARLELLRYLASEKKLPAASLEYTLSPMLEFLTDMAIDSPNAEALLGQCLAALISEKALGFPFVMKAVREHCPGAIPKMFTALFKDILRHSSSSNAAREILDSQNFSLPALFPQKADAISYLESSKLWVLQPGLWVSSIAEPKLLVRQSAHRSGFLPWMKGAVPADVLADGMFAEHLARSLLTADNSTAPSPYTLQALEWVCKEGGPTSVKQCLWGLFRFFLPAQKGPDQGAPKQSEDALARTFDKLLEKNIASKAELASWYQSYKKKQDTGKPQHTILEAFFKKRVLN
ncbi:unnamed protein product, partial [Scytosiphon promiscuus]